MVDKPYNDPETLARLKLVGKDGTGMSHKEIAEELGCSIGTISLRFNEKYHPDKVEEINSYDKSDFEDAYLCDSVSDDQRYTMVETLDEELPVKVSHGTTHIDLPDWGYEIFLPNDMVPDAIEEAEASDTRAFVAVPPAIINEKVKDRMDESNAELLIVTSSKAVHSGDSEFDSSLV